MTQANPTTLTTLLEQLSTWDTATLQQALEMLRQELRNRQNADYLYLVWHVEDIQWRRPDLTDSQCREVLSDLSRRHDAGIGINWDVIDCVADDNYPAPDNLHELWQQVESDSHD
jgi:hypothetical protein